MVADECGGEKVGVSGEWHQQRLCARATSTARATDRCYSAQWAGKPSCASGAAGTGWRRAGTARRNTTPGRRLPATLAVRGDRRTERVTGEEREEDAGCLGWSFLLPARRPPTSPAADPNHAMPNEPNVRADRTRQPVGASPTTGGFGMPV